MKHYILSLAFLILSLNISIAQHHMHKQEKYQRFKSDKIAYLTDQLELTPEEAQAFWPLFNDMEQKRMALFEDRRTYFQNFQEHGSTMKDKELADLSRKIAELHVREGAISKEYNERFLKVLTAYKVLKLHISEKGFRHHLMKKYRKGTESDSN